MYGSAASSRATLTTCGTCEHGLFVGGIEPNGGEGYAREGPVDGRFQHHCQAGARFRRLLRNGSRYLRGDVQATVRVARIHLAVLVCRSSVDRPDVDADDSLHGV